MTLQNVRDKTCMIRQPFVQEVERIQLPTFIHVRGMPCQRTESVLLNSRLIVSHIGCRESKGIKVINDGLQAVLLWVPTIQLC